MKTTASFFPRWNLFLLANLTQHKILLLFFTVFRFEKLFNLNFHNFSLYFFVSNFSTTFRQTFRQTFHPNISDAFQSARNVTVRDLKYNWKVFCCEVALDSMKKYFFFAPTWKKNVHSKLPSFVVGFVTHIHKHHRLLFIEWCACVSKQHLTLESFAQSRRLGCTWCGSNSALLFACIWRCLSVRLWCHSFPSLSKASTFTSNPKKKWAINNVFFLCSKIKRNTNCFIAETMECCVARLPLTKLRWCLCLTIKKRKKKNQTFFPYSVPLSANIIKNIARRLYCCLWRQFAVTAWNLSGNASGVMQSRKKVWWRIEIESWVRILS